MDDPLTIAAKKNNEIKKHSEHHGRAGGIPALFFMAKKGREKSAKHLSYYLIGAYLE